MTVDSAYRPEVYVNDDDVLYTFEIESVGSEAIQIWVNDGSTRVLLREFVENRVPVVVE